MAVLLELPRGFLHLLQIEEDSSRTLLVSSAILVMFLLVAGLFLTVIVQKLTRAYSRRENSSRERNYEQAVLNFVFSEDDFLETAQLEGLKRKARSKTEFGFLRRVLLTQYQILKSTEQARAFLLYQKMEMLRRDFEQLNSKLWWVRLEAIIRLDVLKNDETKEALMKMTEDENDLVAVSAMRALGNLNLSQEEIQGLIESLSRRAPLRKDVFSEILSRLAAKDPSMLIRILEDSYDPQIAVVCITTLGILKWEGALPLLERLLSSSADEVVSASARAIGEIGGDSGPEKLEALLGHSSSEVRRESLTALYRLGVVRKADRRLVSLSFDPSMEVRRRVFDIRNIWKVVEK